MFHTEFRSEPLGPTVSIAGGRIPPAEDRPTPGGQAAVDSLALELCLHGELSARSEESLELLSPTKSSLLLQHGGKGWGASGEEGLQQTVAAHQPLCRNGSIFTARLDPESPSNPSSGRVHLTCVGDVHNHPLLLGMIETEPAWSGADGPDRLSRIADQFRAGLRVADEACALLQSHLQSDSPCLIVNRASGRILAANQSLLTSLNRSPSDMIGLEYSSLAADLFEITGRRAFKLQNLTCGDFRFGLVRILVEARDEDQAGVTSVLTGTIVPAIQDSIAAIMLAASHQATLSEDGRVAELRELSDLIVEETTELDRAMVRLALLLPSDQSQTETTRIEEATEAARETVQRRLAVRINTSGPEGVLPPPIETKPRAVEMIVEAILAAHLTPDPTGRPTRVVTETDAVGVIVRVETDTNRSRTPNRHHAWQECAEQLAGADHHFRFEFNDHDQTLTSTIRITSPTVRGNHA